ncbi:MAG: ATP-binding protein [Candidatus Saliniplasma sp.]
MFADREEELITLDKAYENDRSEFLVIYGRRRIGKTALVKQLAKKYPVRYYLAEKLPLKQQAIDFSSQVADEFDRFPPNVDNWKDAFEFTLQMTDERVIIAIDEFPYLIQGDDRILSHFQKLWDEMLSEKDVVLILIGSSISIMENEILDYKSPLFGRRTKQMEIKAIPIQSYKEFLPSYSLQDLVRVYGVCGGVPAYLQRFKDSEDVWDNISNNFFEQDEYMFSEPDFILQQELREPSTYRMILKAISGGKHRLGKIAKEIHRPVTDLPRYLSRLERIRIVRKEVPYGESIERSRNTRYEIQDNLMSFYFKYIYPHRGLIIKGNEADILERIRQDYDRYIGRLYEKLVKENIYKLGLPVIEYGRWWHKGKEIDIISESEDELFKWEIKWSNLSKSDISKILDDLKDKRTPFEDNKDVSYVIVGKEIEDLEEGNLHLFDLEDIMSV